MEGLLFLACVLASLIGACKNQCDQRPFGGKLRCCNDEKDINCFAPAQKTSPPAHAHMSAAKKHVREAICYCDSHCQLTGDCCPDAQDVQDECKVSRDCTVGDWGEWGGCNKECGIGQRTRRRNLEESAVNGGSCPALKQEQGCIERNSNYCKQKKKAYILPVSYRRPKLGQFLFEKILPAIRLARSSNRKSAKTNQDPNYSYCVTFRVFYKSSGCDELQNDLLQKTKPVCVECQSRATSKNGKCRGQGVMGARSRWEILGNKRCFGNWLRLGRINNCSCNFEHFSNFVFV